MNKLTRERIEARRAIVESTSGTVHSVGTAELLALCDLALQSLPAEPRQTELLCPTDGRPCWPTDAPRYEVELCAECPLHAEWHQPGASPVSPEQRSGNLDNAASGASTDTEATP
jgi:hypothetical protein